MANEVTKVELYGYKEMGDVRGFDCASGVKISKGTVLKLASARTASASTGTGDIFAGVASADKSGTDYTTRVGCWENGIFEFVASQAIIAGDLLQTAAPGNYLIPIAANTSSKQIIVGVAQKSVAADAKVQVRVNN